MGNKVYQIMELVGTSCTTIEDAINNAIAHASQTNGKLEWYEVLETRGYIDDNKVKYHQVRLKIGYHAH